MSYVRNGELERNKQQITQPEKRLRRSVVLLVVWLIVWLVTSVILDLPHRMNYFVWSVILPMTIIAAHWIVFLILELCKAKKLPGGKLDVSGTIFE